MHCTHRNELGKILEAVLVPYLEEHEEKTFTCPQDNSLLRLTAVERMRIIKKAPLTNFLRLVLSPFKVFAKFSERYKTGLRCGVPK